MKRSTFSAQLALLDHRWPWPAEAKEAREDYALRLWAKCELWEKPMAKTFAAVVETAISRKGQYGRPTVVELVNGAHERIRQDGGHDAGISEADLKREREARNRAWIADCERRRADPGERAKAVASFARGMRVWKPGTGPRRLVVDWLRDFWGVPMDAAEHARLCALPQFRQTASARHGGPKEPVRMFEREPGEDDDDLGDYGSPVP